MFEQFIKDIIEEELGLIEKPNYEELQEIFRKKINRKPN
jgi:hypothetical protein